MLRVPVSWRPPPPTFVRTPLLQPFFVADLVLVVKRAAFTGAVLTSTGTLLPNYLLARLLACPPHPNRQPPTTRGAPPPSQRRCPAWTAPPWPQHWQPWWQTAAAPTPRPYRHVSDARRTAPDEAPCMPYTACRKQLGGCPSLIASLDPGSLWPWLSQHRYLSSHVKQPSYGTACSSQRGPPPSCTP